MMNCHEPLPLKAPVSLPIWREPERFHCSSRMLAASTRRAHQEVAEARRSRPMSPVSGELLDDQFQSLDRLIVDYVRSVAPASHAETDTDQFVAWLQDQEQVSPEERDLLLCLYSRRAVETAALHKRIASVRFNELLSHARGRLASLETDSAAALRLNPVHIWATLQTRAMLGTRGEVPACVLFYQVGRNVRTAVLKNDVLPLVRALEQRDLRVRDLFSSLNAEQAEQMSAVIRHLVDLQIVAIVSPWETSQTGRR